MHPLSKTFEILPTPSILNKHKKYNFTLHLENVQYVLYFQCFQRNVEEKKKHENLLWSVFFIYLQSNSIRPEEQFDKNLAKKVKVSQTFDFFIVSYLSNSTFGLMAQICEANSTP